MLASPGPLRVGNADAPTRTAASRGLGRLGLGVSATGDLVTLPVGGTPGGGGGAGLPGAGSGGGGDSSGDGNGGGGDDTRRSSSRSGVRVGSDGSIPDASGSDFNPDANADGVPDQRFAAYDLPPGTNARRTSTRTAMACATTSR